MIRAALTGLALIVTAIGAALTANPPEPSSTRRVTVADQSAYTLDGIGVAVTWGQGVTAGREADEARRAYEQARVAQLAEQHARNAQVVGPTPSITGTCAAMKPEGFPDSIIWRESRGDPNARNPSGAYGCAQIMPFHYRSGGSCTGMDYQSCWAALWDGGRGAAHWACTRESGCA